jgi:hypothetical protein
MQKFHQGMMRMLGVQVKINSFFVHTNCILLHTAQLHQNYLHVCRRKHKSHIIRRTLQWHREPIAEHRIALSKFFIQPEKPTPQIMGVAWRNSEDVKEKALFLCNCRTLQSWHKNVLMHSSAFAFTVFVKLAQDDD